MIDIVDVILRSMSIMRTQRTFCICYRDCINQQIEIKTVK